MKKLFLLAFVILSISAQAQKGLELRIGGGLGFLGADPWIETKLFTATMLYNFNGVLAIGPTYTSSVGATFRIDTDANKFDATLSEIGISAQFTFLRAGKIKLYGIVNVTNLKGKTDPLPDFRNGSGQTIILEDSSFGLGFGGGILLNLGSSFYFNILDLYIRPVGSEFMDMDKGFEGNVGPLFGIRTGFSYVF